MKRKLTGTCGTLMLSAFIGAMLLTGCKRDKVTTGQVFISTAGAAVFRLGAVPVQVVDREQAMKYMLQQREYQKATLKQQLEEATQRKKVASNELAKAREEYTKVSEGKSWTTSQAYINAKNELEHALTGITAWEKQLDALRAQVAALSDLIKTQSGMLQTQAASSSQIAAWQREIDQALAEGDRKRAALEGRAVRIRVPTDPTKPVNVAPSSANQDMQQRADQLANSVSEATAALRQFNERGESAKLAMARIEKDYLTQAKNRLDKATSAVLKEETNVTELSLELDTFDVEECFESFNPIVIASATTDADGEFTITYKYDKPVVLFVRAKRAVMADQPEKYFWLVDVPPKGGRVLLNNNNLLDD